MWRLPFSLLGGLNRYKKRSQRLFSDGLQPELQGLVMQDSQKHMYTYIYIYAYMHTYIHISKNI